MEIRLLGPFVITAGGQDHVLRRALRTTLFACLLLKAGQHVAMEDLTEEIWGDTDRDRGRNGLHAHIMRLRRDLQSWDDGAGPHIESRYPGYTLHLGEADFDVQRFRRLHTAFESQRHVDKFAAIRTGRAGLGLWRGRALAGHDGGPLTLQCRTRLEAERLGLLLATIDLTLEVGWHELVLSELYELISKYPLEERFCHQLMTALYRAGRPAAAIQAYEKARTELRNRLGTSPSPALEARFLAILRHDPLLAAPSNTPSRL
ncbi:AfsR/SARP family transcriptional regulator [Nonomuraea zeae]|uniref:AfsR/SARP family transcriptional regulator n=1 Tax=Nonomuraea zeae TaxID=1642303 RepID=A0A5S4GRM8_9ACTN|nr:AfsR/SARP family transcriptional regulator [Nonomuraea zeae]TMR29060.1 AfsR/SARP family transcriptional regulator [Nonomuraea zeae]